MAGRKKDFLECIKREYECVLETGHRQVAACGDVAYECQKELQSTVHVLNKLIV